MSAKTIELLPDVSAADVLQRVSGVTVQRNANGEAKYAIIRGMDKRYNYTTVDGIKMPSPDDKMRFVPMDMFPTEILDRIEVIKNLTPDMEGDAIGGVMNLKMKEAPDHKIMYASAGTGYNENLLDQKYSYFLKGTMQSSDPAKTHGSAYAATPKDFSLGILSNKDIQAPANGLFNFTIGNRFLMNKKLGVIFSGSYHNIFKATNTTFFNPASQPGVSNLPEFDDIEIRKYSTQEQRIGLHTKIDYKLNDKNTIALYGIFVQLSQFENRSTIDTTVTGQNRSAPGLGNVAFKDRIAHRNDNTASMVLEGSHILLPKIKLNWKGAISKAQRDVPDMTSISTGNFVTSSPTGNVTSPTTLKSMGHTWQKTTDQDQQIFADITYLPTIAAKEIEFKGGGMYRHKQRTDYYNDYSINNVGTVPAANIATIVDSNLIVSNPQGSVTGQWLNYNIQEDIAAAYVQTKFQTLEDRLQVLFGARVENTQLSYNAPTVDAQYFPGTSGSLYYTDFMPSAHLKYKLSKKENLRMSYFRSTTRPGFFELVPYSFAGDYFTEVGNYNLDRTKADNIDLRYELFPKGIDQILVGAFYKNIQDAIEYHVDRRGKTSAYSLQPQNDPNRAQNFGLEAVVTKYFHYWGVSANYTFTQSAVTTTKLYNVPSGGTSYVADTVSQTRPLQGQAAHVANLALIYKNPTIGFNAHLSWQYTGRNIAFVSAYKDLDYWHKGTSYFALSVEKHITKQVVVYAKVQNLLNFKPIIELKYSSDQFKQSNAYYLPYQTGSNLIVQRDTYGRNYLIGIRYKLD